ncbi:unnamed protein product [Absidia cylindrospora]
MIQSHYLLLICIVIIFSGLVEAQTVEQKKPAEETTSKKRLGQRYTVQFQSPANNKAEAQADQKAFLEYLQQHHINVTVRYKFTDIMNGMSVQLVPTQSSNSSSSMDVDNLDLMNDMINSDGNIVFGGEEQRNLTRQGTNDNDTEILARRRPAMFLAQTLKSCPYIHRYWPGKRYSRPNVFRSALPPLKPSFNTENGYDADMEEEDEDEGIDLDEIYIDPGTPNMNFAHMLTGVDKAKHASLTGKGIKIGILDSGVDYKHPSLGGCFGENCLIQYGYDLVGDNYGESTDPTPDDDPRDLCDGHGTHVAGILAANDTIKGFEGVAPGVTLGAWRIFGCQGDTDDDIILAAADMAAGAGMDVINLSLGGGVSAWGEDALAVALSNLANRGIVVVVAQGNEGRDGIARTPSPAIGEHVLAVGSVDNASRLGHLLRVYHKGRELGSYEYTLTDGSQFVLNGTDTEFATLVGYENMTSEYSEDNDTGCDPIMQDIVDKVILVKQGGCDFGQKAMQVQNAGGTGLLIYNPDPEDEPASIDIRRYTRVHIPVASLTSQDGFSLLRHYYQARDESHMTMKFISEIMPIKNVGHMSVFSTWGPDPELHVKPDIVGVGGSMYSTFPMEMGAYTTMSGTSMATPYISGCVALLMQATRKNSPESIIRHLLNYAKPVYSPDGIHLESMAKQGSGLVQIYDSILASTNVHPYKISLNDTDHFQTSTQLMIENTSNATKTYQLGHLPAMAISGYDFKKSAVPARKGKYHIVNGTVQFETDVITLERHEKKNVTVYFEQPPHGNATVSPLVYGGFLQLRQITENEYPIDDKSIHVPYFGVLGNQRDLPIFDTIVSQSVIKIKKVDGKGELMNLLFLLGGGYTVYVTVYDSKDIHT